MSERDKKWEELLNEIDTEAAEREEIRRELNKKIADWVNYTPVPKKVEESRSGLNSEDAVPLAKELVDTFYHQVEFSSILDEMITRAILKKEEVFAWKHQILISFEEMGRRQIIFNTLCFRILILRQAHKLRTKLDWEPTVLSELPETILNAAAATYDEAFKIDFDENYTPFLE